MGFPFIIGGIKLMSNISILVNRFRHLFYSPAFGGPDLGGAYLLLHSMTPIRLSSCFMLIVAIPDMLIRFSRQASLIPTGNQMVVGTHGPFGSFILGRAILSPV